MNINVTFRIERMEFDADLAEDFHPLGETFREVIMVPAEVVPEYEGSYRVTPSPEEQTLPTAEKKMRQDLTVNAIPFFDVSNTAGGKTIYIGSEV